MKIPIIIALGVFAGNCLIVPLINETTFKEGFYIGLLAAVITLLLSVPIRKWLDSERITKEKANGKFNL